MVSVRDSLQQTVHVILDLHRIEGAVVHQGLIQILLHELEHQGQLARGLIIQHFDQLDDVVVR